MTRLLRIPKHEVNPNTTDNVVQAQIGRSGLVLIHRSSEILTSLTFSFHKMLVSFDSKRKEELVYLFIILPTSANSTFIGDFWSYCGCSECVVPYILTELSSCMLLVIFIIYQKSYANFEFVILI